MTLGLLGTSVIHLSKGFMAYGLNPRKVRAKKTIYILGILLNFTNPFWVIVSNRFSPTPYYTSMYGFGLLPLLVYSRIFLGQKFRPHEVASIVSIIIGTTFLGYSQIVSGVPSMYTPNPRNIVVFALGWIVGGPLILSALGKTKIPFQEVAFGFFAGGMAALDAVLKGIAQSTKAGSGFLPTSPLGWIIFVGSFLGALGAFVLIQWSYLRHCRPAMMGSVYDVSYTTLPFFILAVFRGFSLISIPLILGLGFLFLGVIVALGSPKILSPEYPQ